MLACKIIGFSTRKANSRIAKLLTQTKPKPKKSTLFLNKLWDMLLLPWSRVKNWGEFHVHSFLTIVINGDKEWVITLSPKQDITVMVKNHVLTQWSIFPLFLAIYINLLLNVKTILYFVQISRNSTSDFVWKQSQKS